jgi:tetratricopeptide (TPR) repeat protein
MRINTSILGILISAYAVFLVIFFITQNEVKWMANSVFANIFLLLFLFALIVLLSTNSRSGIIGFAFTLALFPLFLKKSLPNLKVYWITTFFILSILLSFLFYYKKESTNGRLLVYKIARKIVIDNVFSGIGLGQFSVTYNKYQAEYFANHSIDSNEALLADNTFYAFNDFLQFICETGIIGFIGLVFLVIYSYNKLKQKTFSAFQKAALGFVICILIGSLFSYPLQTKIIQFLFIFYLAMLFMDENQLEQKSIKSKKIIDASVICIAVCTCIFYFGLKIKYQLAFNKADNLSQLGYRRDALEMYRKFDDHLFCDGYTRFIYARELYNSNRLEEANKMIKKAKLSYIDNEVLALSANILAEQKQFKQAEEEFKKAIFTVPNRIKSRYEIFRFYLNQKDTSNAKIWQYSILNMKIKIPSAITDNFVQRTKAIKL